MNIIPRIMPEGAWLSSFSFRARKDRLEFGLDGMVSLADSDKEFDAVNDIVLGLRNESNFSQRFKEIEVISMEKTESAKLKLEVIKFVILCH